ncbi:MAG: hypothetical protein QOD70_1236 [Frankiales bacterium]|nr:hypothetical protein [Frankiales bacterium]
MEQGNRRQSSVVTFGPVGRVLTTGVLFGVLAWFLQAGLFGLVGAFVWGGWIMPRALRDTWRRAPLPSTELTRLRDQTRRELSPPSETHLLFRDKPDASQDGAS